MLPLANDARTCVGESTMGYGLINIVIEHEQRCVVMLSPTRDADHISNNVEDIPQH